MRNVDSVPLARYRDLTQPMSTYMTTAAAVRKTAKVRHPDFSQAIKQPEFQLTPAMQDAAFKSRVAGELAYWLETHLDESRRIANLSPSGTRRGLRQRLRWVYF
jgi:hypothetical protein